MRRFISFRDFDWILLGFVLIICGLGVFEIYSATRMTKFVGFQTKQVYWIIGGLILMFFASEPWDQTSAGPSIRFRPMVPIV